MELIAFLEKGVWVIWIASVVHNKSQFLLLPAAAESNRVVSSVSK